MTAEQERGYLRLLLHMWNDETCSLPDDDGVLAKLSLMGEGWLKGGSRLVRECFVSDARFDGRITNLKLLKVREIQDEWRRKSAEGGKKSGVVRAQRSKNKRVIATRRVVEPNANQTRTKREPKGKPSVFSLQSSNVLASQEQAQPPLAVVLLPPELQTQRFAAAWSEWLTYRRERRLTCTPRTLAAQVAKCVEMGGPAAVEAINASIAAGWQGIFPPKQTNSRSRKFEIRDGQERKLNVIRSNSDDGQQAG